MAAGVELTKSYINYEARRLRGVEMNTSGCLYVRVNSDWTGNGAPLHRQLCSHANDWAACPRLLGLVSCGLVCTEALSLQEHACPLAPPTSTSVATSGLPTSI